MYRFGKFARRHRFAVGMLGTAFVASLVFGSAMAWFAREAAAERDRANQETQVARRVTAFAAGIFELANPARTGTRDISARELLDASVRRLRVQGEAQRPDVRAALLEAAGNAYRGLGDYEEAASLLDAALEVRGQRKGEDPVAYAQALLSQALLKRDQGDLERALTLTRNAERVLESEGAEATNALQIVRLELAEVLSRRAEIDAAAALAERTLAATSVATDEQAAVRARALMTLGYIRTSQGDLADAERLLQEAYELYLEHDGPLGELTIEAKDRLANVLVIMGQSPRAEPLLRELVDDVRQVFGDNHTQTGISLNNLGNALSDIPEKYAEAADVYLEAAAIARKTRGDLHAETGTTYNNLGALYLKTQEWQKADDAYRQAVVIRSSVYGAGHPDTVQSLRGRGEALGRLGRLGEAEQLLRESVASYTGALGPEHWRTANAQLYLGWVLGLEGRMADARREMDEAYSRLVKALGADHPRVAAAKGLMLEVGIRDATLTAR